MTGNDGLVDGQMTGRSSDQTTQNHFQLDFSVDQIFIPRHLIWEGALGKLVSEAFEVDLVRVLVQPNYLA
jgi:hypothetical protein